MKIEVTQEDIDMGQRNMHCTCPIARAIGRKVNTRVSVVPEDVMINQRRYDLPSEVGTFVKDFDANAPVSPFTFELEL